MILTSKEYPIRDLAMLLVRLDYAKAHTPEKTSPEVLQMQKEILRLIGNGGSNSKTWTEDVTAKHEVRRKRRRDFLSRVGMALFGGTALVVPMLIMTLHPTELKSLLTTSIFVFTVAIGLAWYMDETKAKDIMAATAAYAAVLVVFVGASGTNG